MFAVSDAVQSQAPVQLVQTDRGMWLAEHIAAQNSTEPGAGIDATSASLSLMRGVPRHARRATGEMP